MKAIANWMAASCFAMLMVSLAACGERGAVGGGPTLNVFAPTDAASMGLLPAATTPLHLSVTARCRVPAKISVSTVVACTAVMNPSARLRGSG